MPFDIVEVSNSTTVDAEEIWAPVVNVTDIQYKARLGTSRILTITVSNPNNRAIAQYKAYQRIRVLEQRTFAPFFLGRIKKLSPNFSKGTLDIVCQDYMEDLMRKKNVLKEVSGTNRSELIRTIVNGQLGVPASGVFRKKDIDDDGNTILDDDGNIVYIPYTQSVQTYQVEKSPQIISLSRKYGDDFDGYESIAQSIHNLGMEDAWQDTQVILKRVRIYQDEDGTDLPPTINWFLATPATSGGDGVQVSKPYFRDELYIGSRTKFRSLRFSVDKLEDAFPISAQIDYNPFSDIDLAVPITNNIYVSKVLTGENQILEIEIEHNAWEPLADVPFTNDDLVNTYDPDTGEAILPDDFSLTDDDFDTYFKANADIEFDGLFWIRITTDADTEETEYGNIDSIVVEEGTDDILANGWDFRVEGQECLHAVIPDFDLDSPPESLMVTVTHPFKFSGIELRGHNKTFDTLTWVAPSWTEALIDPIPDIPTAESELAADEEFIPPLSYLSYFLETPTKEASFSIATEYAKEIDDGKIKILSAPTPTLAYFEKGTRPWDYSDSATKPPNTKLDNMDNVNLPTFTWKIGNTYEYKSAPDFVNEFGVVTEYISKANYSFYDDVDGVQDVYIADNVRRFPMTSYRLGENNINIMTRVTVIGQSGARSTEINEELENALGVIEERTFNDWTLLTPAACSVRARAILKQHASINTGDDDNPNYTGFNVARLSIARFPSYEDARGVRRFVREGDVVLVAIARDERREKKRIPHEPYVVHEISYGESEGKTVLTVSRDNLDNMLNDDFIDDLTDSLQTLRQETGAAGWSGSTPSQRSASQIIWHTTEGEYRPLGRVRFNAEEEAPRTVDYDDFIGEPSKDTTQSENWKTNLKIKQDDGGAILFRGLPDGEKVEEAIYDFAPENITNIAKDTSEIGGIFHNSDTEFLNASVPTSVRGKGSDFEEPKRQLQNILAGEWGTVTPKANSVLSLEIPVKETDTDSSKITLNGEDIITNLPLTASDVTVSLLLTDILDGVGEGDRDVIIFENLYGGGNDTSKEPMLFLTPDISGTLNQVFIPYVEEWIRLDIEYPNDTSLNEYYWIGCVVRFASVIPTVAIGNSTGGVANAQVTREGQLVIPASLSESIDETTDGYSGVSIKRGLSGHAVSSYVVFARY